MGWTEAVAGKTEGIVAVDGKTIRKSREVAYILQVNCDREMGYNPDYLYKVPGGLNIGMEQVL